MKEFYFEIKGKMEWGWLFPPLYSYKVSAENKKEARKAIDEMYSKKFPLRVLKKDLDSNDFLLNIREIKDDDVYINRLWDVIICVGCKKTFRRIDLYNDGNCKYKGIQFCSDECYEKQRKMEENIFISTNSVPVIYKITNKKTKMCYVGQTTQSFTLRWWQHFKWGDKACKFQKEISNSSLVDWTFEVLEVVNNYEELSAREYFYISKFNSINCGYNTAKIKKIKDQRKEVVR